MELEQIVNDIAKALKQVDHTGPVEAGKKFKPGIGPLGEDKARDLALDFLRQQRETKALFEHAKPMRYPHSQEECDLVIPGKWCLEIKLLRPFGDNGKEADEWSKKILHPYRGSKSALGDALKLKDSGFAERKAVMLFAYEHEEPQINLETILKSFEVVAKEVCGLMLSKRHTTTQRGLIHPAHQVLHVIAWEVSNTYR